MNPLALGLYWFLQLFSWTMLIALIFQLIVAVKPGYRPRGILLYIAEISLTITDVPLKQLRKFVKPLRIGTISLDLAWTVLYLFVALLESIVVRFL